MSMHIKLLGKRYELVLGAELPEHIRGDCDAPHATHKQIRIAKGLAGEELVEVLIHEMLHAVAWALDEEVVEQAGRDIARVLTRLKERGVL